MNRPKATRLRLFLAIAAVAAFAVFLPASANADFAGGTGVTVTFPTPTPGAHSDIVVQHTYAYDGEPSGTPGAPGGPFTDGYGKTGDDLKQWVLDTPAGFYGNPRAIPESEKCTQDEMNSYVKGSLVPGVGPMPGSPCPATAQVGTAVLTLVPDASGPFTPGGSITNIPGKIYLVQSASPLQEVPTTLFTVFAIPNATFCPSSTCAVAALSKTQIAPVTSGPQGDYRLRSASELIDRPDLTAAYNAANSTSYPANTITGYISGIQQTLWGDLSGHGTGATIQGPFQTNPNTCTDWNSTLSSRTYGNGGTVGAETPYTNNLQTETLEGTANPGGGDTDGEQYAQFASTPTSPDCSGAKPPLSQTTSASLTSNDRGGNPGLTVSVNNPNPQDADRAKKLVTTLPASISVNVNALGNICQESDLAADTCPAASQVGTAQVGSPLLSATQQGRVYMTKGATPGLPYLSIWVDGAFKFRLDATTKFVGPSFNQIETTFDNLPELPFDKFDVTITGGSSTNSLLFSRVCPSDGSTPDDGPVTFSTTGYTGATKDSSSATSLNPCYGVSNPTKVSKCVKVSKKLSVKPKGIVATSTVANVQLWTGTKSSKTKKLATDKKSPFSFKVTLKKSKFKKNKKYYYKYRVQYKDGKVIKTKTSTFKTCK